MQSEVNISLILLIIYFNPYRNVCLHHADHEFPVLLRRLAQALLRPLPRVPLARPAHGDSASSTKCLMSVSQSVKQLDGAKRHAGSLKTLHTALQTQDGRHLHRSVHHGAVLHALLPFHYKSNFFLSYLCVLAVFLLCYTLNIGHLESCLCSLVYSHYGLLDCE